MYFKKIQKKIDVHKKTQLLFSTICIIIFIILDYSKTFTVLNVDYQTLVYKGLHISNLYFVLKPMSLSNYGFFGCFKILTLVNNSATNM